MNAFALVSQDPIIKFHLFRICTYTSSTIPFDHDSVVKNQHTNKDLTVQRFDPLHGHPQREPGM